jgi:hypothetical protein
MERRGFEPLASGLQSSIRPFGEESGQAGITGGSGLFVRRLAGIAVSRRRLPAASCGICAG